MKLDNTTLRRAAFGAISTALLALQPGTLAAENSFSGEGPFGGRVTSLAFDPSDATRAYALGAGSGLFFSDDGGANWSRFDVDHPDISRSQISSFGIDPNTSSTLWVVDGGAEVARTTDQGATWTASTTGLPVGGLFTLTVDQANSGTLFVDSSSGLFRSTDNGDTWTDVSTGLGSNPRTSIMQSPSDPSVFMALGWDGPFKSTDGGQTWMLMANNLPLTDNGYVFARVGVFDNANSDIALINISNEQNWRTLDGGVTWAPYGIGVPNDFFTEMVRDPSSNTRIFLGTGNNDVFVSSDNGLTWGASDLSGLGQYTVNDIAFNPDDPALMLIGTANKGVYASSDAGANWSVSSSGFVNVGVEALAMDASGERIYAATTGGASVSNDSGDTWMANVGTYDLWSFAMEIDPLNSDRAFAGSSCCGLYETLDAGSTWTRIDLGLPVVASWVTGIDIPASNPQQYVFSDFNRGLFGTKDGGATWEQLSTALEPFFTGNVVLDDVDAAETNNDILFVASPDFQRGGVFRSDDFGASWTRKSGDGTPGPSRTYTVAVHPENPNIVFAGASSLQISLDGGDNWSLPATGVGGFVKSITIDQDNPLLMYAVSENNGLYRSVDGGNNWTQAPDDNITNRSNYVEVDPTDRGRVLIGYDDIGYQEITYSADLSLSDDTGAVTVNTGETVALAMTVTANGPIDANAVELDASIPAEFTIDSATATSGACTVDGQNISCSLGTLAMSAASTINLSLTGLTDGAYSVSASTRSLESDPDNSNNSVSLDVSVGDVVDTDGDGVADSVDNCTDIANPGQNDTDADGYGNACDADFNNDCVVNFIDISSFANEFLGTTALFDINSDGVVNFLDFVVVSQEFLQTPGPGQGICD